MHRFDEGICKTPRYNIRYDNMQTGLLLKVIGVVNLVVRTLTWKETNCGLRMKTIIVFYVTLLSYQHLILIILYIASTLDAVLLSFMSILKIKMKQCSRKFV